MKVFSLSSATQVTAFSFVALMFSACGKNAPSDQIVKSVVVETRSDSTGDWIDAKIDLSTAGIQLPSITLPIFDPTHPGASFGSVSFAPLVGGGSELGLNLNFTEITHLPSSPATLPNGTGLPIAGLDGMGVISVQIPGSASKVYVASNSKIIFVGAAIAIKEFESLGSQIGGLNFFPSFQFGAGIIGNAGIFTGTGAGKSGIAVFFETPMPQVPQATPSQVLANAPAGVNLVSASRMSLAATASPGGESLSQPSPLVSVAVDSLSELSFAAPAADSRKVKKMKSYMYGLSQKNKHLILR